MLLVAGTVAVLAALAIGVQDAVVPIAVGQLVVVLALSAPLAWSQEERLRASEIRSVVWVEPEEVNRRLLRSFAGAAAVLGFTVGILLAASPDFALLAGVPLVWAGAFGFVFLHRLRGLEKSTGRTGVIEANRAEGSRRGWHLAPGPVGHGHMATAPASTGNATPVT